MRRLAVPLLFAALLGAPASPARGDPGSATVLIRIIGEMTAAVGLDGRGRRPSVDLGEIQFATGSGFIISPSGYVLTNSHVIRSERVRVLLEGQPVELTLSVRRIQVVITGESGAERSFDAAVVADDAAVDLAILSIAGSDLPVVSLGDAGVLQRGDPVTAWGYPLGDLLKVDSPDGSGAPPVNAASGSVATLRAGGVAGLPPSVPYIQITAPINPGASGGPLTDRDGYLVGVVQAKIARAEGVAFAISVEEVRRFLERVGIDTMLPVAQLSTGAVFDLGDKGVRMRLPSGFADTAAARTRIDSGRSLGQVRLVVDRLVTPWDAARVERTLLDGRAFGTGEYTTLSDRLRGQQGRARLRLGLAKQSEETDETRMMYAIADLGDEVVIARYLASADDVAFNFSVLRDSLLSLEATLLASHPLDAPLGVQMSAVPAMTERPPIPVVPANTTVELIASPGCSGLAAPAGSLLATLDLDFTVRFVASWWAAGTSAADVKRACLGPDAAASTSRTKHLDVTWVAARVVVTTAAGLPALLESWAPEAKSPHTRDALLAWGRAVER